MCVSNYIKAIFTPYLVDVVDATLSIVLGWKTPKSFWFILQVHFSEGKNDFLGFFVSKLILSDVVLYSH